MHNKRGVFVPFDTGTTLLMIKIMLSGINDLIQLFAHQCIHNCFFVQKSSQLWTIITHFGVMYLSKYGSIIFDVGENTRACVCNKFPYTKLWNINGVRSGQITCLDLITLIISTTKLAISYNHIIISTFMFMDV